MAEETKKVSNITPIPFVLTSSTSISFSGPTLTYIFNYIRISSYYSGHKYDDHGIGIYSFNSFERPIDWMERIRLAVFQKAIIIPRSGTPNRVDIKLYDFRETKLDLIGDKDVYGLIYKEG